MPLNRIHPSKVTLNWIRLLNQNKEAGQDFKLNYIPGINIFHIKEAGWFFGYVDIGFWAAWLYVVGSIFYVIDCLFLFNRLKLEAHDDNPSGYGAIFNFVACIIFILNAIFCFLDWWLQYKQVSIQTVGFEINDTSEPIDWQFSYKASFYYFNNNLFFLAAAVVYTVQALWWINPQTDYFNCTQSFYCSEFSINFWAAFCYLVSGLFAILEYYDYCKNRERQGLQQLSMFTSVFSEYFDWFGWGDWFYLLAGIYELYQAMDVIYIHKDDDVVIDSTYLTSQSLFLIDSIFYFVGYILYCLELKKAFNSGILTPDQFQDLAKHVLPPDQQEEVQIARRSSLQMRRSQIDFINNARLSDIINSATIVDDSCDESLTIAEALSIINSVKEARLSRSTFSNPLIDSNQVVNNDRDFLNRSSKSAQPNLAVEMNISNGVISDVPVSS